jgi:hypothetical protein
MDRKQFLKSCVTGLCGCAAATLPVRALAAETAEDWRLPFVKQRYAKLIATLSDKMDPAALTDTFEEVGKFCSSQQDEHTKSFNGNIKAFSAEVAKQGSTIAYDEARKTYTLTYSPGADCFCPLNSLKAKTPGAVCDCSVGWAKHTWGILLGKEPKVALKEAVLRGGKVCKFEITPA